MIFKKLGSLGLALTLVGCLGIKNPRNSELLFQGDWNGDGYEDSLYLNHTRKSSNVSKRESIPGTDEIREEVVFKSDKIYRIEIEDFDEDGIPDFVYSTSPRSIETWNAEYMLHFRIGLFRDGSLKYAPLED